MEGDLESTAVHGEDAAVEEEYGDLDETEAGALEETDCIS